MGPLRDYQDVMNGTTQITNSQGEETGSLPGDAAALNWYYSMAAIAEEAGGAAADWLPYLVRFEGRYYLDLVWEIERSSAETYEESARDWLPAGFVSMDEDTQLATTREAAETAARQLRVMAVVEVYYGVGTGFQGRDELVLRFSYPLAHAESVSTAVDTLKGLPVYGG